VNLDHGTGTDIEAINANYTSIVPSTFDLTAYKAMETLGNSWGIIG